MRRTTNRIVALAVVLTVLTGCSGSPARSGDQGRPRHYASNGTFEWAIKDDLGAFDPYHSQSIGLYAYLAYDPLVNLRPDGSFVSGLAEKWTVNPNSATFVLRPGITCSDGSPMRATQVASAISYVGNPKNESSLYGVNVPTTPVKVTADDETRTVEVTTSSPFGLLLNTVGRLPILCEKGVKDPKLLANTSAGTGPFVLTKYVPGQSYTFTVRKDYVWGPAGARTSAPGTPATVVLRHIENETTAANLLLSGRLDLAGINGDDRQRLDGRGIKKIEVAGPGAWLRFNHRDGRPTSDMRVRSALVQALNRDEIVKVNTAGIGKAARGLISREPKPCPGDTVAGRLPNHDVAAANRALDELGWTRQADGTRQKNGKPLSLDLHYVPPNSPLDKPTAELIAQQWAAIGVKVKLTADTYAALSQVWFKTGDYDVYMFGSGFGLPTQQLPYLSGPVPPKGLNFSGINNPEYDAMAAKALTMLPPAACKYWNESEYALYRNVDIAPIAERPWAYYFNDSQAQMIDFEALPTTIRVFERQGGK